jgi:hypothetical protein
MTLFQKSPLEFPRKNYDDLSMLIESKRKSKGRKKQFGGHRVQTPNSQAKKSKKFNGY